MKFIHSDKAPSPGGHYSQGVSTGNLLFISGQLAVDATTGEKKLGSIAVQTAQVLYNMEQVALAAGANRKQVVKTTIYISDISLWSEVNTVYTDFFGTHRPARAIIPCGELHHGFLIELEAVVELS